jgi:beta-N-acetylhexosaminidase
MGDRLHALSRYRPAGGLVIVVPRARLFLLWVGLAVLLGLAVVTLVIAVGYQSPRATALRPQLLWQGRAGAAAVSLLAAVLFWRGRLTLASRVLVGLSALIAMTATLWFLTSEHRAVDRRAAILATPPAILGVVGRHVIAGYDTAADLRRLIAVGGVGGVFITARNVQGLSADAIAAEIASFQKTARDNGFEPLVIATDQEGGIVSRLSPPLPLPPPLSSFAVDAKTVAELDLPAIRAAGARAGQDLAAVGVTMNFAPVVDLNFGIRDASDRHSRITDRAIAADPAIVSAVARAYCEGLASAHVQCTLKHFPGLGRVAGDTHMGAAALPTLPADLAAADWRPFRETLAVTGAAVMVGHVSVEALDRGTPASVSRAVVTGVLRQAWGFKGLIVTDDLTMAATADRSGGTAMAAVAARVAGVDFVLISYDETQVFPVLEALLAAEADGRLPK